MIWRRFGRLTTTYQAHPGLPPESTADKHRSPLPSLSHRPEDRPNERQPTALHFERQLGTSSWACLPAVSPWLQSWPSILVFAGDDLARPAGGLRPELALERGYLFEGGVILRLAVIIAALRLRGLLPEKIDPVHPAIIAGGNQRRKWCDAKSHYLDHQCPFLSHRCHTTPLISRAFRRAGAKIQQFCPQKSRSSPRDKIDRRSGRPPSTTWRLRNFNDLRQRYLAPF